MLILPGATAALLASRLPMIHLLTLLHAGLSAVSGTHLAIWLECSIAGAMVVAGMLLFIGAWLAHVVSDRLGATAKPVTEAEEGG